MGSKTFDGVRFASYPKDHPPPHVHGFYAEVELILELLLTTRTVTIADREDNPRPQNGKRSDVAKIARVAQANFDELARLWKDAQS